MHLLTHDHPRDVLALLATLHGDPGAFLVRFQTCDQIICFTMYYLLATLAVRVLAATRLTVYCWLHFLFASRFPRAHTLREIKPRTHQAHHSKANCPVRVISSHGRIRFEQSRAENDQRSPAIIMDAALGQYNPHRYLQPTVNRLGFRLENS